MSKSSQCEYQVSLNCLFFQRLSFSLMYLHYTTRHHVHPYMCVPKQVLQNQPTHLINAKTHPTQHHNNYPLCSCVPLSQFNINQLCISCLPLVHKLYILFLKHFFPVSAPSTIQTRQRKPCTSNKQTPPTFPHQTSHCPVWWHYCFAVCLLNSCPFGSTTPTNPDNPDSPCRPDLLCSIHLATL